MVATQFHPSNWASLYAQRHLQTDPGIREVFYLPDGAPEREIRLVEVNELIAVREHDAVEPIEFGVDRGSENEHLVQILDVSPDQWAKIRRNEVHLPTGWSLNGVQPFSRN
jgi:hypothetical protein